MPLLMRLGLTLSLTVATLLRKMLYQTSKHTYNPHIALLKNTWLLRSRKKDSARYFRASILYKLMLSVRLGICLSFFVSKCSFNVT